MKRLLSEELYRATFEQASVGIAHSSLEGRLQSVNAALCHMIDCTRAEALELHIRDITHPEDIGPSLDGRMQLLERSGTPYQREIRLRRKDGSYLWVNVTTTLLRKVDGAPLQFVSVLSDISKRKRAEEEANRLRAAMDVAVDAIFITDPRSMRLLYVNSTACQRLGYSREQLLQKPPFELVGKTREELRREHDEVIAAHGRGTRIETSYVRSDGGGGWTELHRRALSTDGGIVIVTIARDITERKRQQEKIERLSRAYAVLGGIHAAIVRACGREELLRESGRIVNEGGGFEVVWVGLLDSQNRVAEPLAWQGRGESVERLRGVRFAWGGKHPSDQTLLAEMIQTRIAAVSNDAQNDGRVPSKDLMAELGIRSAAFLPLIVADRVVGVVALYSPARDHFDEAEVKLLSALATDLSLALEHLEKSERAAYLALYDELTGLPNRRLLSERLAQFGYGPSYPQAKFALVLLDIERMRSVNKSLGRRAGDALLRQFSERLTRAAGATATARVSSNQFAVVLQRATDRPEVERRVANLVRACFAEPYSVEGAELKVGAKTGQAMFPEDGADIETLLVNAETALRKAKEIGERHVFYTPDLSERTGAWVPLKSGLFGALERDELILHYQPKVDSSTRVIVGLEALIRWQSPELGLVSPGQFIPLMEETGMILEVGAWALQRASLDHRKWVEQGFESLRVAVNVSAVQLRQRDFVQAVQQAILQGVAPTCVDLEITESLVMQDVEENIRKLNEIRELGVQVAIDDFGTGYSSLAYLAKLPVQALKIDRLFITDMLKDSATLTLVQTIVSLAHTLGLKVIAEGVEEERQAEHLRVLRCDQIQGYLVGKPVPFDEMTALLAASRAGGVR
jgi:PAS domain S-box-containing protein/diguanylate cyclase (GGDEF)-like protein